MKVFLANPPWMDRRVGSKAGARFPGKEDKGGRKSVFIPFPFFLAYATALLKKNDVKVKLNSGKIQIVSDAYLETDYEHRWEGKPSFFFLRTIFDKYFFKPYTKGYQGNLLKDYNDLMGNIKSFLNLYRYSAGKVQTA